MAEGPGSINQSELISPTWSNKSSNQLQPVGSGRSPSNPSPELIVQFAAFPPMLNQPDHGSLLTAMTCFRPRQGSFDGSHSRSVNRHAHASRCSRTIGGAI